MYLKSLTLRGFKSFASATTFQLEPGITCVVGPNGSGKSNFVDALAWVMGEQGAKSLRGGKMEDVIFAGTSGRPPLGRAEVVLAIDNTDGALPIDYAEVTIARTMFRNGGSDYAINGHTCRLLDVQELLSDSGIGRELHVIVGQGQLDTILHASPDERRGLVEEAAGVLKHRKRKEKTIRKLDATQGNLTRLADLLTEIRRQLKPLGRQAEVANRASNVSMDARDARARLLADDVVTISQTLQRELADEEALRAHRAETEAALLVERQREAQLEEALMADAPKVLAAQETWFGLASARERLRSSASLAAERIRNVSDHPVAAGSDREPDELEADAARVRAREEEINAEVLAHRRQLEQAIAVNRAAESAHVEEDRRVAALLRAAADRREGLARLTGQVNARKSRSAAANEEIGRLTAARQEAVARADRAQRDFTALETRIAGLDAGEGGLDAEHEGAASELDVLDAQLAKLHEEAHAVESERAARKARMEALETAMSRKDGSAALLTAGDSVSGLLGSVSGLVSVRHGFETAIAAALGSAAGAVAVKDIESVVDAIGHLKAEDLGRAEMVLASGNVDEAPRPESDVGATYAVDLLDAPDALMPALRRLLGTTVVVDDLRSAQTLVAQRPHLVAVTRDGDVIGFDFASGGSSSQPSLIELRAVIDESAADLEVATASTERLRFEFGKLTAQREGVKQRVDVALAKLHESDAAMAAVAERLGQLGALARSAKAEAARVETAMSAAEAARDNDLVGLAELERRLAVARDGHDEEPDTTRRERLADEARASRQAETDARLALRTLEERGRALHGRAQSLIAAAQSERAARADAIARRERRNREAAVASAVGEAANLALAHLDGSLSRSVEWRADVEAARKAHEQHLAVTRARIRELAATLATLTDTVHRDEVLRAEHRMRMEQLEQRSIQELGLELEALVADYGPDNPVPVALATTGDEPGSTSADAERRWTPYVRDEQEKRLRSAEHALAELGRINPLALEEFSALEERHRFLTEQLEDLKKTRRDLLAIVKEVDERVERVFTAAYADVAREFADVFARLFPGGEGRLVLTEPSDMLATGIDVEARPAGKLVKRLSLLSGGERSLVAVAFLVALFKARPSPFYILDEVEAALDDTNLGRLLELYDELRETSQLLVITHQKRSMEIADALYGVSMRGDGVSTVVSQRLREPEAESA
ncbi:MAG: chromosome segregation protein SMC [Nocardioidaceae bacterium]